jgi:hypothetical protein
MLCGTAEIMGEEGEEGEEQSGEWHCPGRRRTFVQHISHSY